MAGAQSTSPPLGAASVRADEVARFDALARRWWDPSGPMAPLHAMNPLRVGWIDRRLRARSDEPSRVLDVGCGAGLAAEGEGGAVRGRDGAGFVAHAGGMTSARRGGKRPDA